MRKLTPQFFAITVFSMSVAMAGGDVLAQITATPAAPRRDTPQQQDEEPQRDSRAGGALSREAGAADAPETGQGNAAMEERATRDRVPASSEAAPAPAEREAGDPAPDTRVRPGEGREVAAKLLDAGDQRMTVRMQPVGSEESPREQRLQVSESARIVRNGEPANLSDLETGDNIRFVTSPGDSTIVVQITATPEVRGTVNVIEGNPRANMIEDAKDRPQGATGAVVAQVAEEAVLPIGIEVLGVNQAALVTEMLAAGPAAQSGVLIGDLIIAINGQPIPDTELIEQMLFSNANGAQLTIRRGNQEATITVVPGQMAPNGLVEANAIRGALVPYNDVIGPVDSYFPAGAVLPGTANPNGFVSPYGVVPGVNMGPGANNQDPNNQNNQNPNAQNPNNPNQAPRPAGSDPRGQFPNAPATGSDPRNRVPNAPEAGADPRRPGSAIFDGNNSATGNQGGNVPNAGNMNRVPNVPNVPGAGNVNPGAGNANPGTGNVNPAAGGAAPNAGAAGSVGGAAGAGAQTQQ